MIREDQLSIRLSPNEEDKNNLRVDIVSTRKSDLAKVFVGKTPADALPMIPRLYSICGMAHSHAAIQACQPLDDSRPSAIHEALCLNEMLREHVLHIALHWTAQIGLEPPREQMPTLMQAFETISLTLSAYTRFNKPSVTGVDMQPLFEKLGWIIKQVDTLCFGNDMVAWSALQTFQHLSDWTSDNTSLVATFIKRAIRNDHALIGRTDPFLLPLLSRQQWMTLLSKDTDRLFCAQPEWQGRPCETGPLERQARHPLVQAVMAEGRINLLARQLVRVLDMLSVLDQLCDSLQELEGHVPSAPNYQETGAGVGVVETVRGRLVHAIDLQDGLIRNWSILAPTEWNFHPKGAAAQSLSRLIPGPGLEEQARQIMLAIDPCIAFDLLDATGSEKGASYA